ncbi:hypothetical protein AB7315_20560 [Providencia manganoxydans]|uniref:hypothetical protein n=2 Tax=Providencia manganoxydans TaxID=2923283 RepID=UPI0032DB580B
MSIIDPIDFPNPTPIIRQHLSNATFYYKTLSESRYSSLINVSRFNHFNALLNANLDGVYHAKTVGLHEALSALKRWQGHEDAFIYTLLFNELDSEKNVGNFWLMIKELGFNAFLGAIEALLRVESKSRNKQLALIKDIDPDMFVIASLKLKADEIDFIQHDEFLHYLNHPSKEVKVAVCDYAKKMGLKGVSEDIWQLCNIDTDIEVKYAALDTLSWLSNENERIYSALAELLRLYLQENTYRGTQGLIHSQTMENIARLMGYTFFNEITLSEIDLWLPDYLKIIYYTHSGNAAYLPSLINYLDTPELSILAFKGLCLLTGIDINSPELTFTSAEQVELSVDSRIRFLSSGVNQVNPANVKKAVQSLNLQGTVLLGKSISISHCEGVIKNGYQIERHIANWYLCRLNDESKYNDICRFNRVKTRNEYA